MMLVSQPTRHILLIDPETYVWEVVRHGLGATYRTSTVATRSAALRILNDDPPALIVAELVLSRASGLPLAVHALRRRIPVVMTTSNHDLARRLMRLGCVILRKPHSPTELRECVGDALKDPDNNLQCHRRAFDRIRADRRECDAILRSFGQMRDEVLLALRATGE